MDDKFTDEDKKYNRKNPGGIFGMRVVDESTEDKEHKNNTRAQQWAAIEAKMVKHESDEKSRAKKDDHHYEFT